MDLPVDFMSHYIFEGLRVSRIMTLLFELRDQCRIIEGRS